MRVERLQQEFDVRFEVYAFDLRPGIPPEGLPREKAYPGRTHPPGYVDSLIQTARECGIDMKRPALVPNTRKVHEATEFARENGALMKFHRAVFDAYWVEERNIGDPKVLCAIAAGCGLDAEALRAALADGRYAGVVEEQMSWGRAVGISGVPTFVFEDRFAVVGAQDYDVLRDVARRVIRRGPEDVP